MRKHYPPPELLSRSRSLSNRPQAAATSRATYRPSSGLQPSSRIGSTGREASTGVNCSCCTWTLDRLENMRMALANPHTVAMIGLKNPVLSEFRAKSIFNELGSDIEASAIPFLSDLVISCLTISSKSPTYLQCGRGGKTDAIRRSLRSSRPKPKRPAIVSEGIRISRNRRRPKERATAMRCWSQTTGCPRRMATASSIKPSWPLRLPI